MRRTKDEYEGRMRRTNAKDEGERETKVRFARHGILSYGWLRYHTEGPSEGRQSRLVCRMNRAMVHRLPFTTIEHSPSSPLLVLAYGANFHVLDTRHVSCSPYP